MRGNEPRVAVLMGSASDKPVMRVALETLREFGVGFTSRILSAHRTPDEVASFVGETVERGVKVFICGAGMAAHLAGAVAARTIRPVLAVPLAAGELGGLDALLSSVQMPGGIPVAVFAVGKAGAKNAALFALQCLSLEDDTLASLLTEHRRAQREKIISCNREFQREFEDER